MSRSIPVILTILFTLGPAAVSSVAHGGQRYTAQRRPRVTVMQFKDTNATADESKYGESVSAMLVTFLKRKSQFVVVERQDVQSVLAEWQKNQEGQTKEPLGSADMELLERIDVIIQGSATLLGDRIELDGKLLSREDGRIIAAAQRSGPIDCLRQIVDRLGIALENGFLTPYYGRVQLTIYEPENVHFLLTPILTPDALDEEKPPGELEATTFPGEDQDLIKKWIANPATHTIENILAGWYSLRLKREGYEDVKIPNSFLRAVKTSNGFEVRYHKDHGMIPLSKAPEGERFNQLLVRVDPLATNEIDLTERNITMRKKQGALAFTVVNENKEVLSNAKIMLRSVALAINPEYHLALQEKLKDLEMAKAVAETASVAAESLEAVAELEDGESDAHLQRSLYKALDLVGKTLEKQHDEEESNKEKVVCDFFEEELPHVFDYDPTVVYQGESFDLADFKGGELYFEEYRGERVPVGMYEFAVWVPRLQMEKATVIVSEDRGEGKSRRIELERRRRDVLLVGKSDNKIRFRGLETHLDKDYGTDTTTGQRIVSLPVDLYEMESDAEGFGAWKGQLELRSDNEEPPTLDETFGRGSGPGKPLESITPPVEVRVKNTIWVGGRYKGFRPYPHTFYNPRVGVLLDQILEGTAVYDWSSLDAEDDKLAALADQLRDIDLLILNEDDMSRIRVFPELAGVIRRYIDDGHSLMAFIAREGDYQNVLGRSLTLKRKFSTSTKVRLNFEAGDPKFEYDVDLGWIRPLLKLKKRKQPAEWRVVSYTKKQKKPRVVESGSLDAGGYVMVWFETSRAWAKWQAFVGSESGLSKVLKPFRQFFVGESLDSKERLVHCSNVGNGASKPNPATEPEAGRNGDLPSESGLHAEEDDKFSIEDEIRIAEAIWEARLANDQISLARSQLKNRALLWAEYLMYRRLDGDDERVRKYRERILSAGSFPR